MDQIFSQSGGCTDTYFHESPFCLLHEIEMNRKSSKMSFLFRIYWIFPRRNVQLRKLSHFQVTEAGMRSFDGLSFILRLAVEIGLLTSQSTWRFIKKVCIFVSLEF